MVQTIKLRRLRRAGHKARVETGELFQVKRKKFMKRGGLVKPDEIGHDLQYLNPLKDAKLDTPGLSGCMRTPNLTAALIEILKNKDKTN